MKKTPLVFLHGFCEDSTMWDAFTDRFPDKYEVVKLNLPGFGHKKTIQGGLDNWAKQLFLELDELKINQFVLIGHSLGAYVGLAMLAQQNHRFLGFVFFHSTSLADNEERKLNRLKQIEFVEKHGTSIFVKQLIPALFSPETEKEKVHRILSIAERQSPEGIIAALSAMKDRPDRTYLIVENEIPFVFIGGKQDQLIPWQDQLQMTQNLPNAHHILLKKSAHMGFIEEAHSCKKLLLDKLNELFPSRG